MLEGIPACCYSPLCPSIHPSISLSFAKVCGDPVFLSPNRSPWLTPCQGLCCSGRRESDATAQRATAQIRDSDTLSLFLCLPRSALSPWCTHVDLEGCILAGEARSRERMGWVDGDGVCEGDKGDTLLQ